MMGELAIPIGLISTKVFEVTESDTISAHVAEQLPKVLGTFVMTKWMEVVAAYMVQPYLPDGTISVGSQVDIEHLAPSTVGQKIHITAEFETIDGAFLFFNITAHDETELVGNARHKRAVISKKLIDRLIRKKNL